MVTSKIYRILSNLSVNPYKLEKIFSKKLYQEISKLVKESEALHSGEVRVCIEASLPLRALLKGQSARERAIELFSVLHVWDTQENNGVLIYLLYAEKNIEIVADRSINSIVAPHTWENICRLMEEEFKKGDFELGIRKGVQQVTQILKQHFPKKNTDKDELPDEPVVL